ncbi:hypothetical protein [Streptomyces syringium]|uniref:hypothetical protein n=1 Tax=Streptomyces syringium TaxID=76729 RepID=UPI0037CDA8AC
MATATPNPIEHFDVPLSVLEASAKLRIAHLLDELQQAQPVTDGRLAEQRHFLDADPDTCVPLPGIAHPKSGGRS